MFRLLKIKWKVLKELSYVLSIPYKATIDLQKQSLTLSDVFGIWLQMQLHLTACGRKKNYETDLSNKLLQAVNERKNCIFDNPLMSSALFLDPRYRSQLIQDPHKLEAAKMTLKNIWRRLITLRIDATKTTETSMNLSAKSTTSDEISFEYNAVIIFSIRILMFLFNPLVI